MLATTASAAGFLLGLWNCQNAERPDAAAREKAQLPPANANQHTANHASQTSTSSGVASAQSSPASQADQSRPGAPDLGSEVFPDANGIAIARTTDAPVILIPRSDWTQARPDLTHIDRMNGISRITVHHTAGELQTDAWQPTAAQLESIREFHSGSRPGDRQWADIAYHFAVDRAGRVWQARPLAYQGAHARGNNEHNMGIVLLGNFEIQSPSAAQLTALSTFIGFVRNLYRIPLDQVFTHGELVDTSCPGKTLEDYMIRCRTAWAADEKVPWHATSQPTREVKK